MYAGENVERENSRTRLVPNEETAPPKTFWHLKGKRNHTSKALPRHHHHKTPGSRQRSHQEFVMARDDYDSDSDLSDAASYDTTPVLLGYPEAEPTSSDLISRLGGLPEWMHPESPADPRLAKCKNCNGLMKQLLQLDAELEGVKGGRRLWIFVCDEKKCRRKEGSVRGWRGVRLEKKDEEEAEKKKKQQEEPKVEEKKITGADIFGGGLGSGSANPFSMGGNPFSTGSSNPFSTSSTASSNPFSTPSTSTSASQPTSTSTPATTSVLPETFASKLRLNAPPSSTPKPEPEFFGPAPPWPPSPPSFSPFYLDADYETLSKPAPIPTNIPEVDYSEDGPSSGGGGGGGKDKDLPEGELDTDFQKFADRLGDNPEQVLRYYFSPSRAPPLLYSRKDPVGKLLHPDTGKGVPRCPRCGAKREVEVQVCPYAIQVLEEDVSLDGGMEWGTIFLGTCRCVPDGRDANGVWYGEEWVGVQWEAR